VKYLLDTCLLSELVKPVPHAAVLEWMAAQKAENLFVSAMTLGELERGVMKLPASRRRNELTAWLAQVALGFEDRVLPFDRETARVWADMCARTETKGRPLAAFDSIIAATALHQGLTVVTRNEGDFEPAGVPMVNPWMNNA
jgi:predicted nucleic acid-binding protein